MKYSKENTITTPLSMPLSYIDKIINVRIVGILYEVPCIVSKNEQRCEIEGQNRSLKYNFAVQNIQKKGGRTYKFNF